jgi:polyisoprenoid-binding protein YceI
MKKFLFPVLSATILLASAFTTLTAIDWQISQGYTIKFAGKDAEGSFTKMTGEIKFDEANIQSSSFSIIVDATSINTGNGMKNKHAKSDKWLDVKKNPNVIFTSNRVSKSATGYQVDGMLDLHGVKKAVSIPFTFDGNTFKGSFSINRMDYNVGTMQGMSKKVSNEIRLDISVPVTKK